MNIKKAAALVLAVIMAFALAPGAAAAMASTPEGSQEADMQTAQPVPMPQAPDGVIFDEPSPPDGEETDSPYDYWQREGYPDDVSYACETGFDGMTEDKPVTLCEIGLVNADEARRAEISAFFGDSIRITFTEARYTYAQRAGALFEIETAVKENRDSAFIEGQLGTNTDRVIVVVTDEALDERSAHYAALYGDLVQVLPESGAQLYYAEDGLLTGETGGGQPDRKPLLFALVCVAVVSLAAAVLLLRRRPRPALLTTDGDLQAQAVPLTRADAADAVKQAQLTPRDGLYDEIVKKIDGQEQG